MRAAAGLLLSSYQHPHPGAPGSERLIDLKERRVLEA